MLRCCIIKYFLPNEGAEKVKEKGTQKAKEHTEEEADGDGMTYVMKASFFFCAGNGWQQHDSYGIRQYGWEKDHRKCHATVDAINTKRLRVCQPKTYQT